MNRTEALKILGLEESATDEEAKKKFRALSKLYHPDINKEPDAEVKFKEINAAYTAVQNPEPEPQHFNPFSGHGNIEDLLQNFQQQFHHRTARQVQNVLIETTISFEESVKGCEKEVSFDRLEPCETCKGQAATFTPRTTPCTSCKGSGQISAQQGQVKFVRTCPACFGQNQVRIPCKDCNGTGGKTQHRTGNVQILAGIKDGDTLRLAGLGNFVPTGFAHHFTDALLQVHVTPDANMSLRGNDVVSNVSVTLLDCLQGKTIKRATIFGEVDVVIPPGTKNKDEIEIPGHGIKERNGSHRFIVQTLYPENPQKLISHLKLLAINLDDIKKKNNDL